MNSSKRAGLKLGTVAWIGSFLWLAACQSPGPVVTDQSTTAPLAGATRASASLSRPEENPGWQKTGPLEIDIKAFNASGEPFEAHANYLAMSTPYASVQPLFEALKKREKLKLKSRGEAHVTVITPPEYKVLRDAGVTIEEINTIAVHRQIEKSDLEPVCLGVGQAMVGGKLERAYFIVVRSQNLLEIRRQVELLAARKAGHRVEFEGEHFYPHITIGFTKQDLHEEQGVIKGANSCLYPLVFTGSGR